MARTLFAAFLSFVLGVSASAQVRGDFSASGGVSAVRAVPAAVGQAPTMPALVSPAQAASLRAAGSISAPSAAVSASAAPALAALPAASAPTPLPPSAAASAAETPAASEAAAPAEAAKPAAPEAAHPREWDFTRWREALPTEDHPTWNFRAGWLGAARLWDGFRRAPALGEGAMGSVFVHPWRSDAVVKVARKGYAEAAGQYMAPDDETVLSYEDYDLARLAAIGAAPRPLARTTVSGRPASVRERVRSFTAAELKERGQFGEREVALIRDLIGRIADGGFVARDLNFGNVMIEGGLRGRAMLVDTLGVSVRDDLDAAGRRAEMLKDRVPWIAFHGFGLGRPLSKALDSAVAKGLGYSREPLAWPKWARWTALAGLLGFLAAAPPLLHAAPLGAPFTLGVLPSVPVFAAVAAVIALAGIPLRAFAHRLAPWVMTRGRDQGDEIMRTAAWKVVPQLAIAAASEEFVFRGIVFLVGAFLLHALMPAAAAIAASSFLSSMVFALVHGYGSVWTRVIGGMLYTAAFVASGSLLLPIAAHFGFNLALYVHGRYLR